LNEIPGAIGSVVVVPQDSEHLLLPGDLIEARFSRRIYLGRVSFVRHAALVLMCGSRCSPVAAAENPKLRIKDRTAPLDVNATLDRRQQIDAEQSGRVRGSSVSPPMTS
jgi:hypothetical protein